VGGVNYFLFCAGYGEVRSDPNFNASGIRRCSAGGWPIRLGRFLLVQKKFGRFIFAFVGAEPESLFAMPYPV
jgi:hypothetical protein